MLLFRIFFFNDTATTEIYTLSLHDALPICHEPGQADDGRGLRVSIFRLGDQKPPEPQRINDDVIQRFEHRSEEHTSELQSRQYLVCRLLLEKKKNQNPPPNRLASSSPYNRP